MKSRVGNPARRQHEIPPRLGSLKYGATKIGCSLPKLYDLIEAGKLLHPEGGLPPNI